MAKSNGSSSRDIPGVIRTSAGLRDALFDEIDGLRSGTTDAKTANAIARIAGEIVNTVHMEIAVQRYLTAPDKPLPRTSPLPEPMQLGKTDEKPKDAAE